MMRGKRQKYAPRKAALGFVCLALLVATVSSLHGQEKSAALALARSDQTNPMNGQTRSESSSPASKALTFAVASVRPSSGSDTGYMKCTADGFSANHATLTALITSAYHVRNYQVSGEPLWVDHDPYTVQAKVDATDVPEFQQGGQQACDGMLKSLLADRFKLNVAKETRMLPVYDLVLAKAAPNFKESAPDAKQTGGAWGGKIEMQAMPMDLLAKVISMNIQTPVLDKTGLSSRYDINMHWSYSPKLDQAVEQPTMEAKDPQSSIIEAVQDQLGLKLVHSKGPVDVIVVKHVERPTTN
jgi:uncharacterized protein (TIGR03435 family)